jgi:hypothetical protein
MTAVLVCLAIAGLAVAASPDATMSPPAATAAPHKGRCQACHVPNGWLPARFAHERTSFPLVGRHDGVRCGRCHGTDYQQRVPQSCAGCHQDPHAQEFGLECRACHDECGFHAPPFPVDAHRRTGCPLVGRPAVRRCDECHVE